MRVTVEPSAGIRGVALAAATTQGKSIRTLSPETWLRWLHAEHSMIRNYWLVIKLTSVPYYVSMHLVRHKIGVEHFVRSQRPDSMNPVDYDRGQAPQDTPVNHTMFANAQAMINISQVRLCKKADPATQETWHAVKRAVRRHPDPYVSAIAEVMAPRCVYRGSVCHELKPCGVSPHYESR